MYIFTCFNEIFNFSFNPASFYCQEIKRLCICVYGVSILLLSMILILDFGTVPNVVLFVFHYVNVYARDFRIRRRNKWRYGSTAS